MKQSIEELKTPKTNIQEVLYTLIKKSRVSIFDFPYLSGYRTRVSELVLKHNLSLDRITSKRNNKFGNSYIYAIHRLPKQSKQNAIELYLELTKNN